MRIFTKYLFGDLIKPTVTALVVLLSILWLMQSLRFMDYIVNKGLDVSTFLWITVLVIPSLLIVILPLSLFAGATYSFKRLNDDNELAPLFFSGQSKWGIVWPTMFMATLIAIFSYVVSLWMLPAGMTAFKALQHDLRQSGGNILIEEGAFNQMGDSVMVYVREKHPNMHLKGILVHDTNNESKPVTLMAEEGFITFDDKGYPSLALVNGTRQEINQQQQSIVEFSRYSIDIMKEFTQKEVRKRGPQELYLGELLNVGHLSAKQRNEHIAEFHKRLLWPLTAFPLILIPAAILIGTKSRRFGSAKPTTVAILAAFFFQAMVVINHNLANKGEVLFLYGQWLFVISVILICIYVLSDISKQEEW
ncbi:MAG: LPS export ABC transporter permease LptF [Pseudomonadota bacterium]|nr:LPS export ABC transporter permease LptF [Pseudomonadota bacterium]